MAVIDGLNINGNAYDLRDKLAVRFNEAQTLTDAQKQQGRGNIDAAANADVAGLASDVRMLETTAAQDAVNPIDGYDAGNTSVSNNTVAPFIPMPLFNNIKITGVKLDIAAVGTLSFGLYRTDSLSSGDIYDPSKYECVVAHSFTATGVQTLTFDDPIYVPRGYVFCIAAGSDTAKFKYGSNGRDTGFYVLSGSNNVFSIVQRSLGVTLYGHRSRVSVYNAVSRYAGERVSILGDSISTFDAPGYKMDGYAMYYPNAAIPDITYVEQTWWKKVIDASGAKLEINASWSASRVTNTAGSYPDFYARCGLLGHPDVIFVQLGTNDSRGGVALGEYDYESDIQSLSEATFRTAYIKGVKALKANYPSAEIVLVILSMDKTYADSIRTIGVVLGVSVIDVENYEIGSTVHPNAAGMRQIATKVLHPIDKRFTNSGQAADAREVGVDNRLMNNMIKGTRQVVVYTGGVVTGVNHVDVSDSTHIVRADTFAVESDPMVETRTLDTGERLIISTDLTTLTSTITYTPASA